jgi:hypothetical protein
MQTRPQHFLAVGVFWTMEMNAHEDCSWSRNKTFKMDDVALSSIP